MEIILAVATILGGIAALGYFVEKARRRRATSLPSILPSPTLPQVLEIIMSSDPHQDWDTHAHDVSLTSVFRRDVNLRFEMKFEDEGIQARPFEERWATRFPDKTASGYYCDLYYGASLLKRFVLVNVDGGRALLPLPRSADDMSVEPIDCKVAQIHDQSRSLDTYMGLARMHVTNGA